MTSPRHGHLLLRSSIAWILMIMGPRLVVWQLTVGHRIHPGTVDKRMLVKL